jgi:hypothetical protein
MKKTASRAIRAGIAGAAFVVVGGLTTRGARAQEAPDDSGQPPAAAFHGAELSIGGSLGIDLISPRIWFEIHADEMPPTGPPCCFVAPPAPVIVAAPAPAQAGPTQLGIAVNGLIQSGGASRSAIGGVAAALQVRTSRHSLLSGELQSLASNRGAAAGRREELVGLMAGRLFAWDAALAPYLELAGGFGRASIDSQTLQTRASQLVGRVGLGLEMRLGPHLVLDSQLAQVHRLRLDRQSRTVAATDPAFIGDHEQSIELRLGLGYRF